MTVANNFYTFEPKTRNPAIYTDVQKKDGIFAVILETISSQCLTF